MSIVTSSPSIHPSIPLSPATTTASATVPARCKNAHSRNDSNYGVHERLHPQVRRHRVARAADGMSFFPWVSEAGHGFGPLRCIETAAPRTLSGDPMLCCASSAADVREECRANALPRRRTAAGVSYSVSTLTLPALLRLPSSSSAAHGLATLTAALRLPILALTTLAAAPFLLSFALSSRSGRHPYLLYTGLLAILSTVGPSLIPQPTPRPAVSSPAKPSSRARMESSYEVLGDAHSDAASEEEVDDVNGEEVRATVEGLAQGYVVRTALSALGFAMAVLGIWGDGAPQAVVYIS
ncbi:hypothetical protein G7046_g1350 [Stylonectria norvegica]|nr:hypothetical protein G7046_g1350 [Stylonectria norvegica]